MAHYHLGYAYQATGRSADAIVMFEKVLALRGSYPELEGAIQMLRQRVDRRS
jgi:hypothetical protein